jgi:hypothetical protein
LRKETTIQGVGAVVDEFFGDQVEVDPFSSILVACILFSPKNEFLYVTDGLFWWIR